jgi:uncharacterized damage-inducible protein DinB
MRKSLILLVSVAWLAPAQMTANNPLSGFTKGLFDRVKANVKGSAEKMPEENYSFKPTPEVRSFGQLVGHVADANYMFCATAMGEKPPVMGIEKTKTAKADLVQALNDSFAYCDKAYDSMTDAAGVATVKFFGRDMPKLGILELNSSHDNEHYGNMVTYLRLKGIVPPSSAPQK